MKGKKIMKKMFLTLVAVMSMTMAFAEDENTVATNTVAAYDMKVNYSKLAEALGLSMDQLESVEDVHKTFCIEMMNAANAPKDDRKNMVDKAIEKNLKYMHYILNNSQYSKYLLLLNTTMNNRGLNK
ncbi:hypothetical protein [Segatella oris]|uniref:hypothetical protein n=1 Tax=Segatella oris TaxID=28135 RepID=UPI003613715F